MWDDLKDSSFTSEAPDPLKEANIYAQLINSDRHYYLESGIERIIADAPWINKAQLISEVVKYYDEAISRIPSFTKFPEAKIWVDYVLTRDKKLMELANLSKQDIAILRSTNDYLTFRGYKQFGIKKTKNDEKCRTVFIVETDHGPMHIKNVDDPITYWKPSPPLPEKAHISKAWWYHKRFIIDGVGSGLHIDDEPEEIFPLPVLQMVNMYAYDTFSAVEFLKKYSMFWGGCNIIIFDRKYNAVAIEKCSRNFFELFQQDELTGSVHVSGMVCRDPSSPQAKYQKGKRTEYMKLFNLSDDGPDACFWNVCDKLEIMLRENLRNLGNKPKSDDIIKLFIAPYPSGLRKDALKLHPQQGLSDYTLMTRCTLFEKKKFLLWQRKSADEGGVYPDSPEICQYE